MIKEFKQNDVFVNIVKTKPHFKFSIYNGQAAFKNDFANNVDKGFTALNDLNDPPAPPPIISEYAYIFSEPENSFYLATI
jgi:hypothetical protein